MKVIIVYKKKETPVEINENETVADFKKDLKKTCISRTSKGGRPHLWTSSPRPWASGPKDWSSQQGSHPFGQGRQTVVFLLSFWEQYPFLLDFHSSTLLDLVRFLDSLYLRSKCVIWVLRSAIEPSSSMSTSVLLWSCSSSPFSPSASMVILSILPWAKLPSISARPSVHRLPSRYAVLCWELHYLKRLLETFFVHVFSRGTMPLTNLFKNCTYYWGFAAYVWTMHPSGGLLRSATLSALPCTLLLKTWLLSMFAWLWCSYILWQTVKWTTRSVSLSTVSFTSNSAPWEAQIVPPDLCPPYFVVFLNEGIGLPLPVRLLPQLHRRGLLLDWFLHHDSLSSLYFFAVFSRFFSNYLHLLWFLADGSVGSQEAQRLHQDLRWRLQEVAQKGNCPFPSLKNVFM